MKNKEFYNLNPGPIKIEKQSNHLDTFALIIGVGSIFTVLILIVLVTI